MMSYRPELLTDFRDSKQEVALRKAIARALADTGRHYPIVINGERVTTRRLIASFNPSNKDQVVGNVSGADAALAEQAIEAAYAAFRLWSRVPAEERARYLFKAAAILRRRKHEFSAWLMLEAGKTRSEADADTAEAIDFLEYYGRLVLDMDKRANDMLIRIPGEDNRLQYVPLGVGVVIPPWNFPLAILAGMTAAAVVAGNTVVLKPASATPVIAYRFYALLEEAGLPAGVVNYLPGSGARIGDFLVRHKLTRFIAFTGSKEIGLRINELAAKPRPGQLWLKRFIGEMGGKDAIIVDHDADLEQAAEDIVVSAFGYSGQKCSACSRAIVHRDVYDEVLERCVRLTHELKVGDVLDFANFTGPVIDEHAYNNILRYLELGFREGTVVAGGDAAEGNGYFIRPTIIAGVDPGSRIMQEEIFGPVLAFAPADDFDHALRIANNTEFGLTGSVYTRNRAHIERARAEFHVGNLYLNRKCTGAVVGVHPFGGFNMSGTDSKAGGPDYLLQFTQLKSTSERL